MPTPNWKIKAKEINAKAETEADSLLTKLKDSKWAALILGATMIGLFLYWLKG